MKRLKLFLLILALLGMMAAVVVFRSPYAPVVGGVRDIEELWAIEDTREESEAPLVTALSDNGMPLVYNREEDLFYCPLGLGQGDEWPQLHLTAPQGSRVSICFSDDYTYDSCCEAIRKGYAYELMAYTDDAYHYFSIVFTGLPVVCIAADEEITDRDTPADVTLSAYGEQAVSTHARIHRRGGLTRGSEKPAYKVEFTRKVNGGNKVSLQTPGLGPADEFLLLPMPFDSLFMRDRLSWDVYGLMRPDRESFAARTTAYTEVVVNGEYAGVYLMMKPFDMKGELSRAGTRHLRADRVYRTCVSYMSEGRPLLEHPVREGAGYELFFGAGSSKPFDALQDYLTLLEEPDDARFGREALARMDLVDMLTMEILIQAGGMTDNVFNNLFIWAENTHEGYVYHYIPWDMDLTWGLKKEDIGEGFENWMYFPVADRLINLDPDGRVRGELLSLWRKARENALSLETIERLTDRYAHELNDSGAMRRNAERWGTENYLADAQDILDFAEIRFALLDETMARIAENPGESVTFLERTQFEGKGSAIVWEAP